MPQIYALYSRFPNSDSGAEFVRTDSSHHILASAQIAYFYAATGMGQLAQQLFCSVVELSYIFDQLFFEHIGHSVGPHNLDGSLCLRVVVVYSQYYILTVVIGLGALLG